MFQYLLIVSFVHQVSKYGVQKGDEPDGNIGSLHLLPLRQFASVDVLDFPRVGDDGLFFKIADEAMAGLR